MAVAWQSVRTALVQLVKDAVPADVLVNDGPVVSGEAPSRYVTVGHWPSQPEAAAGAFEHEVGEDGFLVTERGSVICELAAVTGDTTVPSVFDLFDLIATAVQADQSLGGVLRPASTVTTSALVAPAQTISGAVQRLLITIEYLTRL